MSTAPRHVLLGIISIPLALIAWPILAIAMVIMLVWETLRCFGEGLDTLLNAVLAKVRGR